MVVVDARIWALELRNTVSLLELPRDSCSKVLMMQWPEWTFDYFSDSRNMRLVDCEGEILCVCFVSYGEERKVRVEVSEIELMPSNQIKYVEKTDIGNRALFLSDVVNVPGSVSNNPERWGGKKNCVYYAHSASKNWSVLEVGQIAPKSLFNKTNRVTCSFPFWDFASVLQ
jgi:hypothetical protein